MLFVNKKLWQVLLTRQSEKYLPEIPLTSLDTARYIVVCAPCSIVLENVFSKKCNPQENGGGTLFQIPVFIRPG